MNYNKMKDIREYFEITQEEVASKLNVSRSTYAGWENGIDTIPLVKLNDFCNCFDVSLDFMCDLSDVKKIDSNNNIVNKINIGLKLKEIRTAHNDTQENTAKAIQVERSTYCRYELGESNMTVLELKLFASHYNISMDYICDKIKRTEEN